tara:strand:- start:324 stop:2282 length:1959 start_codon:yes stop_codon:yes gene_type:complete
MINIRIRYFYAYIILTIFFSAIKTKADSFVYNNYNNHGVLGLINLPTARFFDEGIHGVTIFNGDSDQKITLSSSPYDWLEASFFYTSIKGVPYPGYEYQDFKDKGFNIKFRLKQEGKLPGVAVGFYDFAGTGLYSSEYIVSSYGINNLDLHFGLGWGRLNQESDGVKNPFIYLNDGLRDRPKFSGYGGQLDSSKYFAGSKASPFYGLSYKANKNIILKLERDTLAKDMSNPLVYEESNNKFSLGFDYLINDNFSISSSFERGNYFSLKFVYKNNPKKTFSKFEYSAADIEPTEDRYTKLVKNLENNGIGVTKISETSRSIGLELTQFVHSDIRLIEEIISEASRDAGINKNIKKDIKIADLLAVSEIDSSFENRANTIYERDIGRAFNTSTGVRFRPFIASREEFFKGALLLENDSEVVLRKNLFFNINLKYSLINNFDDLIYPPIDTYPAQVRSDIKEYLKNMNKGVLIGRAQFDYHYTPKNNHHLMFTAGILEDMFSGIGMEYLYYKQDLNYAFGFEIFNARKRDYNWGFGHLDYENITASANFYYRNYGLIPFDMKISAGEYLAGDVGSTIEFSRTFKNGVKFGAFATFTDVSAQQFGEGSFDKGIFFNIPIYGNLINYTWRPLTKDPGARLIRKNTLYDLLVKFKPIE